MTRRYVLMFAVSMASKSNLTDSITAILTQAVARLRVAEEHSHGQSEFLGLSLTLTLALYPHVFYTTYQLSSNKYK